MAKQTGLGDSFFVGAFDLSGDIGALSSIDATRAVIDVSPLNVTGYQRLLGRADGAMSYTAFYNPADGQEHPVLSAVGTVADSAAATVTSYVHGIVVGNDAASLCAKNVSYPVAVGADLSIVVTPQAQGAQGAPVEWGVLLTTARQVFAGTAAGSSLDGGAASSFGAAAYIHAFAVASGTATVAVQHSTTGTAAWSDVTGLTWSISAGTAARSVTTPTFTMNRYRRLNVTGTFTGLDCAVNLVVYPTSQT